MAVSYGFFDSVGGDRKYSAAEISQFYDSIVTNGVFQSFKGGLAVSAGTGLSVSVAAGRAIVQSRWILNDAALTLSIDAASTTYGRIDAVVIRLSESSRNISIVVKKGTPASSPVAPSLTRSGGTYEMALAYVTVAASASSVSVTDKRSDSTLCGWAAVREAVPGEIDAMLEAMKTGFDGVVYPSPVEEVQGSDRNIVNMMGEHLASGEITKTLSNTGEKFFEINFYKGFIYIIKNNTSKTLGAVNVYDSLDTTTTLFSTVGANATVKFVAEDNYHKIRIYNNGTGSITFSAVGLIEKQNDLQDFSNIIKAYDLEQGTWSSGEKAASSIRIRNIRKYQVYAGQEIRFVLNPNSLFYSATIYTNGTTTALQTIDWTDQPTTINYSGEMVLAVANANTYASSTSITTQDFETSALCVYMKTPITFETRDGMEVIIGDNKIPQFKYANSKADIYIPGVVSLTYIGVGTDSSHQNLGFSAADIANQLSSTYYEYDANGMTFHIPNSRGVLYFDTKEKVFGVTNLAIVKDNWIVLVIHWYGNFYGTWVSKAGYENSLLALNKIYMLASGTPYYSKIESYNKFMYGDTLNSEYVAPTDFENFLWFTDPHTMYGDYTFDVAARTHGCINFDKYNDELQFVYNSTPTDFVLCGGDWIDKGLPAPELFKLSRAMGECKSKLSPFYNIVGNHDTNYLGQATPESASGSTRFTPECIKDLWYREYDHCYYTFNGRKTKFYVFDTRIEGQTLTDESGYLKDQVKWFANSLLTDNSEHIALAMHIYYSTGTTIGAFSEAVLQIACAYNARASYTFDGTAYDFSGATGKIEFALAGHSHADFVDTFTYASTSIKVVGTINAGNYNGSPSSYSGAAHCIFDIIHVNYDDGVLKTIRIGNLGTDREVTL